MYLSVQAVQNVQTILDDLHCSVKKGPYMKLTVTTVLDVVIPIEQLPILSLLHQIHLGDSIAAW